MKKLFAFLFLCVTLTTSAQMYDPVAWESSITKVSASEYELTFKAAIEDQWHIYSQNTPDGGPLPLSLTIEDLEGNFELIGALKESETHTEFSEIFGVDEVFFSEEAELTQRIKIINPERNTLEATIRYQVCKEVCLNETERFEFTIGTKPKDNNTEVAKTKEETLTNDTSEQNDGLMATFLLAFFLGFGVISPKVLRDDWVRFLERAPLVLEAILD